jgi:Ca-activated chloride channel family protein
MNLTFQTPWLLYLIWVVPALTALWFVMHRRSRQALNRFVSPVMQAKLVPVRGYTRTRWQTAVVGLGSLLLLLAAAGPRWGEREETVLQQARDLVIAIDVSQSMLANDIHPSRLERAKVDAMDLIASLKGDRAALLVFRSKPALVCPLTTDYAFLRQALAGISPSSAPRGETDIGSAISRALDAFSETESSHKAIILISDGEDLSGLALDMAEEAGDRGIPIYTIGLGSRAGSTIPDPQTPGAVIQHEGKPVMTALNDDALYTIAQKSGGSYIPVETAGMASTTLGTLYNEHLRDVTRRELAETRRRRAVERYQWFLLPAFILLVIACGLSRGRLVSRRKPVTTATGMAASILVLVSILATSVNAATNTVTNLPPTSAEVTNGVPDDLKALTGHRAARRAQAEYKKGNFALSAALYRQAIADSTPRFAQIYRYNEAAALAANNDTEAAAETFRRLSLEPSRYADLDAASALGTTYFQLAASTTNTTADGAEAQRDNLQKAGEAFKQALHEKTDDDTLRHDLALTLKQLPEARMQAKALRLAETYAQTQAPALASEMLQTQREITGAIETAATNRIPERIAAYEALAARQEENADRWMPLKQKLTQALAQQQQQPDDQSRQAIANMLSLMEVTQQNMTDSFHQLRDIQPDAYRPAKMAEQGTYQLWKAVAPYEMLLNEDITQQTNAIAQVSGDQAPDPTLPTDDLQMEAAQLTELFRNRFEQTVPPEGTVKAPPAPDDGDESAEPEGITPEVRQQILELATETVDIQREAAALITGDKLDQAMAAQLTARDKLKQIADLLPKPPSDQQQQDQQQPEQQPQQQPQNQPEQQPQQQENQPEQQPQPQQQEPQESDVQKLLQRALEREREFEAEKRKRQNRIPLPPSARDW